MSADPILNQDGLVMLALCALWLIWAFAMWDELGKSKKAKPAVTNCPFCRGMHAPGECPRDRTPED